MASLDYALPKPKHGDIEVIAFQPPVSLDCFVQYATLIDKVARLFRDAKFSMISILPFTPEA